MAEAGHWPPGAGEMARLIRAHGWAATPLGPVEAWPERLRAAVEIGLDSAFATFVWWGPELVQLSNDAATAILRAKHPGALGRPAREVWADVWPVVGPLFERVLATGAPFTAADLPMEPDRGGPREPAWFTFCYSALRDGAGAIAGMQAVAIETTGRIRAEAALREAEERLRLALAAAEMGTWRYRPEAGVNDVDAGMTRLLGLPPGPRAMPLGEFLAAVHPDDRAGVETAIERGAREGEELDLEFRVVRPDGAVRWLKDRGRAVPGPDGRPAFLTGAAVDITARKLAEEALRQSEERWRAIVEQAADYAVFTTDAEGRIETWPLGAQAVFGWAEAEAVGRPFAMTFVPEDRAAGALRRELAEARARGAAPDVRWHVRKDGARVFIEGVTRARVGADGAFLGLLKIGRDATERRLAEQRRREEEERARAELERRVAEATAEVRDLSRRLLLAQEEERRRLALELHDDFGQVLTGLGLQLGVGDAVDGARLEAVRAAFRELTEQVRQLSMDLRPAALDGYGLLTALGWFLERYRGRTGVAVELRQEGADRRFSPEVEVAAYRIVQEALTNVARHAGATAAAVHLHADGAVLTVVVRDRGRGFAKDRVAPGSGLGGMRERAELLGGTLEVDAATGEGVTVTAELPLDDAGGRVGPA